MTASCGLDPTTGKETSAHFRSIFAARAVLEGDVVACASEELVLACKEVVAKRGAFNERGLADAKNFLPPAGKDRIRAYQEKKSELLWNITLGLRIFEHRVPWFSAARNTIALADSAVLSPLFCERDLSLPGRAGYQAKVHESLMEASSAARAVGKSYLAGFDATSQSTANVFQRKSQFLLSQDKHFHIEMWFFAQSGALGLLRVQDLILDHLTTEQTLLDAARSLASFQKLQTAAVLEFASMGAQPLQLSGGLSQVDRGAQCA